MSSLLFHCKWGCQSDDWHGQLYWDYTKLHYGVLDQKLPHADEADHGHCQSTDGHCQPVPLCRSAGTAEIQKANGHFPIAANQYGGGLLNANHTCKQTSKALAESHFAL